MEIETYSGKFDDEIISLILSSQNNEAQIALSNGKVIGTIGLMVKEKHCAILKKFFVKKEFRSQKIGLALYNKLLQYAISNEVRHIILDTPAVAHASYRFYENVVFCRISMEELPVPYSYPDRDSILYILNL